MGYKLIYNYYLGPSKIDQITVGVEKILLSEITLGKRETGPSRIMLPFIRRNITSLRF